MAPMTQVLHRLPAPVCAVLLCVGAVTAGAQTPVTAPPAAQTPPRTASQAPPPTVTPQSYPPEQIDAGRPLFIAHCGFCHGRDAAGGEGGPDLTRSTITAEDNRGDKIGPIVHNGRVDKGMPAFTLPDADIAAIVAFVHDQKRRVEQEEGNRRNIDPADLQSGDAEAGRRYFNGAGGCARCHAPTGDLAGVATRLQGLKLLQQMLYPERIPGTNRPFRPAAVSVTLPSGERVTGTLAHRDEFTIGVRDSSGWYRSWPVGQVKFSVDNPLDAHIEQLGKYTDADMHNVLAYLQTLK
jgi:cytochrome c oxidase cbb3-type subunit III